MLASGLGVLVDGNQSAEAAVGVCGPIVFIGVRGTDAPAGSSLGPGGRTWRAGGYGLFIGDIAAKLKLDTGLASSIYSVSLKYPATNNFTTSYSSSMNAGVAALTSELQYIWNSCSRRPAVVLAGYSQGADVVATTLSRANVDIRGMVKGSVLLGDPAYFSGDAINYPNQSGYGIFSRSPAARSVLNNLRSLGWVYGASGIWAWRQQVRSYCIARDSVCQANVLAGWGQHKGYAIDVDDAAGWLANFILWG